MPSTMKFWMTLASVCLMSVACAEGSPAAPPMPIEPPAPEMEPTCGNAMPDVGEQCDCPKAVSGLCRVEGMDCTAVGRGPGVLLCNSDTCTFDFGMCQDSTPATGGTGAVTGTGGTGR